jgi:putative FmdB family regulatory protein
VPLYEYACLKCGRHTDKIEPVAGPHLKKCPHCGGKVESVITAPAIKFKGAGWYVNDYAAKPSSAEGKKAEGSGSNSSDSKESSSKDSGSKDSSSKNLPRKIRPVRTAAPRNHLPRKTPKRKNLRPRKRTNFSTFSLVSVTSNIV